MDLSWDTALSLVVFMITRPSGSFHEAFLREPWCLISMCDALTWLVVAVVFDDDILVFFFCLCLSLSLSLDDEIDDEVFFRLRSEESILAEWIEDRELKGFVLVLSVVCAVLLLGFWFYKLCLFVKVSFCVLSILDLGSLAHMEPQHWWSIDRLQFLASTKIVILITLNILHITINFIIVAKLLNYYFITSYKIFFLNTNTPQLKPHAIVSCIELVINIHTQTHVFDVGQSPFMKVIATHL